MKKHEEVYIPNGITFGHKMAIIPAVSCGFENYGNMKNSANMKSKYSNAYVWVNKGDPLGTFSLEVNKIDTPILKFFMGTETRSVSIPSPVSGLLIHSNYDCRSDCENNLTAILLPDDEPKAEEGRYMFNSLCRLCSDYKQYFIEPSGYSRGCSEEGFNETVKKQLALTCKYQDALPRYRDYFDEIRNRHPNLRPYIKHLI